jgi:hypothetical protein
VLEVKKYIKIRASPAVNRVMTYYVLTDEVMHIGDVQIIYFTDIIREFYARNYIFNYLARVMNGNAHTGLKMTGWKLLK